MEMIATVHPHNGELTGKILTRKELYEQKHWCRTTNIFIFNSEGHVLCHQRSLGKEVFPGVWFTHSGGHVGADETFESNAMKELEEEAGIAISEDMLIPWRTTRKDSHRFWIREFVVVVDVAASDLVPQPGEVEQFQWLSIDDIINNQKNFPELWVAGTHDFITEYNCMRAILSAFAHKKHLSDVHHSLREWGGTLGTPGLVF